MGGMAGHGLCDDYSNVCKQREDEDAPYCTRAVTDSISNPIHIVFRTARSLVAISFTRAASAFSSSVVTLPFSKSTRPLTTVITTSVPRAEWKIAVNGSAT